MSTESICASNLLLQASGHCRLLNCALRSFVDRIDDLQNFSAVDSADVQMKLLRFREKVLVSHRLRKGILQRARTRLGNAGRSNEWPRDELRRQVQFQNITLLVSL